MTHSQPIRVGIVGLSPQGQGLLERLSLRRDCELILFQPHENPPDVHAITPGIDSVTDWRPFLSESELAAVLFLDGRSLNRRDVQEALAADLSVGVLPPLDRQVLEWESFSAGKSGRLRVLNPQRDLDTDFLAVRAWLSSHSVKPFTSIKRVSWVADLIGAKDGPEAPEDGWFAQWLWDDLDQLLNLVGELPVSVYAAEFSPQRQYYFLVLHFAAGVVAQLERRRSSRVPLDLGWTVSSGYAHGRHYIRTESGEIYDVRAEPPLDSGEPRFDPLTALDAGSEWENSWDRALDVLKVQAAILRSAETKQVILLAE